MRFFFQRKIQDDQLATTGKKTPITAKKSDADVVYIASSSFKAREGDGNLKFSQGTELRVIEKSPNGWWYVRVGKEEGWVPSNVVQRRRGQSNAANEGRVAIKQLYKTVGGYKATEETGISFTPGFTAEVLEKDPCGWWFVRINNEEGWAPSTFLEKIESDTEPGSTKNLGKPQQQPEKPKGEYFIALGDYNDPDIGMLSFKKGQRILIIEKDDGGWWMAQIGEISGWVPSNYLKKE